MENRDIIITEYLGREGLERLTAQNRDVLEKHFSEAFLKRPDGRVQRNPDKRTPEEKAAAISGTLNTFSVPDKTDRFCMEISAGGVLSVLWDMTVELDCGMEVDLMKLPLRQETLEICEYLEENPYELEGGREVMLIVVPGGMALCHELAKCGIASTLVGHTLAGRQKLLKIQDRIRYLDRPRAV